jgi:hypothetical protein
LKEALWVLGLAISSSIFLGQFYLNHLSDFWGPPLFQVVPMWYPKLKSQKEREPVWIP